MFEYSSYVSIAALVAHQVRSTVQAQVANSKYLRDSRGLVFVGLFFLLLLWRLFFFGLFVFVLFFLLSNSHINIIRRSNEIDGVKGITKI